MLGVQSKLLNHWSGRSSKNTGKKKKKKEQTWIVLAKKNKIKLLRVPLSIALAGCICIAKVSGLGNCHSSYFCWLSKEPIPFYGPLCCSHKGKAYIYFIAIFVTWREWVSDWINNKKAWLCLYLTFLYAYSGLFLFWIFRSRNLCESSHFWSLNWVWDWEILDWKLYQQRVQSPYSPMETLIPPQCAPLQVEKLVLDLLS